MSKQATPAISIVTVTYHASDFIEQFLKSVDELLAAMPNLSIVLVDNASKDDTVAKIESFLAASENKSRARLVHAGGNIGFGRGCNTGAEAAAEFEPEYLWFLNPDTIVELPAAEALIGEFSELPTASFVGSSLKDEEGQFRSGAFRFPMAMTVLMAVSLLGVLARRFPHRLSTIPVNDEAVRSDWLSGASFMVKREVFEDLNGFDPTYFLYFEEVDLFVRAQRAGYEAWSTPKSVVYHMSGASTGINKRLDRSKPPRRPKYWFESRRYFYKSNFGSAYFLLVDLAFLLGQIIKRAKYFAKGQSHVEPEYIIWDIVRHSALSFK